MMLSTRQQLRPLIFVIGFFFCCSAIAQTSDHSIFLVEVRESADSDWRKQGTAFLIDDRGYFVTASHLFRLEPSPTPFSGQIRLSWKNHDSDSVVLEGVQEIFHRRCDSDPDLSILYGPLGPHSPEIRAFELGIGTRLNRRDLEIYGYPIGLGTSDGTTVDPGPINEAEILGERVMFATEDGIFRGHSGSPLFDRDSAIAYGVTFGTADHLMSRWSKLCPSQLSNEGATAEQSRSNCSVSDASIYTVPTDLSDCRNEALSGLLQMAATRENILFVKIHGLDEPFSGTDVIPPSYRVSEFVKEIESNPNSRTLDRMLDGDSLTTLEAGALLRYFGQKDTHYWADKPRLITTLTLVFREHHGQKLTVARFQDILMTKK